MRIEVVDLWENIPGLCEEIPKITAFIPKDKKSDCALVIFAGGGYWGRSEHEGVGYAKYFCEEGITCFVVDYRTRQHKFPVPLLDARRGVQVVRHNAKKYGIDRNKIVVVGSSAGGHLAAMLSTYYEKIDLENTDAIDCEDYIPNAQILCYPVIKLLGKKLTHLDSGLNLLGDKLVFMAEELSPDLIATNKTPPAFIWHTFTDSVVPVLNSLDYAKRLHSVGVNAEVHIFHRGEHGLGLCLKKEADNLYVEKWKKLCFDWLKSIGFYK